MAGNWASSADARGGERCGDGERLRASANSRVVVGGRNSGTSRLSCGVAAAAGKGAGTKRRASGGVGKLRPGCVPFYFNTTTITHAPIAVALLEHASRAPHYIMALARPMSPLWQTLLPALNGPVRPVLNLPFLQRLSQPFRSFLPTPFAALAIPSLSLPSFPSLAEIWDGILKAVPKKKTSYRKKRQRFMAGKGLKDVTALNRCSACGRVKRLHILCPYCVDGACTSGSEVLTLY
jgi:large subunit ribosomal protein L32